MTSFFEQKSFPYRQIFQYRRMYQNRRMCRYREMWQYRRTALCSSERSEISTNYSLSSDKISIICFKPLCFLDFDRVLRGYGSNVWGTSLVHFWLWKIYASILLSFRVNRSQNAMHYLKFTLFSMYDHCIFVGQLFTFFDDCMIRWLM